MDSVVCTCLCVYNIHVSHIYNVSIIISKKEAMNLRGGRVERMTQEELEGEEANDANTVLMYETVKKFKT